MAFKEQLLYSRVAEHLVLRPLFWLGYREFLRSGRTLGPSYSSFRKLHCVTRGMLNQKLSREITRGATLLDFAAAGADVLREETPLLSELEHAVDALRRDGFFVFARRLSPDRCAELLELAQKLPADLVPAAGDGARVRFDSGPPRAPRYQFRESDLLGSGAVRRLLADASILHLAQMYLEAAPINDLFTMWWSAPWKGASSEAAQLFHFDMDRIRFLKVFIYLTDVGTENGPHVYVRGSHRGKPPAFFRDRRFSDAEVSDAFPPADICELTGPTGTIFAADTSGLHKGKPVNRGQRLILQLEFANSLFGQAYESHQLARSDDELNRCVRQFPRVFQRLGESGP